MNQGGVWSRRVLVATLVAKDLKTRYRGSVLGLLWTMLNPLFMMLVYTLVFSVYLKSPVEHYAVFVFAGLLPWLWIATAIGQSTMSVIRDGHLLKKVRFPLRILPLVTVASSGINFLLSLPLYIIFAVAFGVPLGWPLIFIPLLVLLQFALLYGLALLLAALNVFYRDIEHLAGNLITLLFFLTPVLYPESLIPARIRALAVANPLGCLVMAYRDVLFNQRPPQAVHLLVALAAAAVALAVGESVFRRCSPQFAEKL